MMNNATYIDSLESMRGQLAQHRQQNGKAAEHLSIEGIDDALLEDWIALGETAHLRQDARQQQESRS